MGYDRLSYFNAGIEYHFHIRFFIYKSFEETKEVTIRIQKKKEKNPNTPHSRLIFLPRPQTHQLPTNPQVFKNE